MKWTVAKYVAWLAVGFAATGWGADVAARHLGLRGSLLGTEYRADALLAYGDLDVAPDVVVIGSSRVAGGLHAPFIQGELLAREDLDVNVYELGLAGLRVEWVRHMMMTSFRDLPPKKLLVIAIEARLFAFANSVVRDAEPGQAEEVRGEWEEGIPSVFVEVAFGGLRDIFAIGRKHQAATQAVIAVRNANGGDQAPWLEKVELERARLAKRKNESKRRGLTEIPDAFADGSIQWRWPDQDSLPMQAWRDVLDLADELPCEVAFIRMPLAPNFDQESMPDIYPLFVRDVVDVLRARGMTFDDLQGPGWNDNPEWFYSTTHLDIKGVIPVSRRLASDIIAPKLRAESSH
jgi:hypothetical protein